VALDVNQGRCILSQKLKVNSYYCLNHKERNEVTALEHSGELYGVGVVSALVVSAMMFALSQSIFINFTAYVRKLLSETDSKSFGCGSARKIELTQGSEVQLTEQAQKSPNKRRKSPSKKKRKLDQSISSFRAILDRDSDSSSIMPIHFSDGGYDSGVGHTSMSTQANLLNQSERINISSLSARDLPANLPG